MYNEATRVRKRQKQTREKVKTSNGKNMEIEEEQEGRVSLQVSDRDTTVVGEDDDSEDQTDKQFLEAAVKWANMDDGAPKAETVQSK